MPTQLKVPPPDVADQTAAQFSMATPSKKHYGSFDRLRMQGKVVCVSGGNGVVGSGLIREWLAEGATVIAPLRGTDRLPALMKELEGVDTNKLSTPVADFGDEESAAAFGQLLAEQHPEGVDHAISCFGGWWQKGVITEQPLRELQTVFENFVAAHFLFTKTLWPQLKRSRGSSMLYITGGAGQRVVSARSGLTTLAMSGLYGLIMAIQSQADNEESPVRVNEMRIFSVIKRHDALENENFLGHRAYSNRKLGVISVRMALTAGRRDKLEVKDSQLADTALTVNS